MKKKKDKQEADPSTPRCYYLGEIYPIEIIQDPSLKKPQIDFNGKAFVLSSPESGQVDLTPLLQSFYTKTLKKLIQQRIQVFQPEFKVKPKSFVIEDSKVRWGSCNGKRELTFNWRLAMLPMSIIDYVIAHEMCHLVHLNHDRSFWRLVGKVSPDYKEAMAYLGNTKRSE